MTILRSGTNQAYSDNWTKAFGGKRSKSTTPVKSAKKARGKTSKARAKSAKR